MKTFKIIFILIIGIIFSCESNTYEEISGDVTNPTYTSNVKSIILCPTKIQGQFSMDQQ